MKVCFKCGEAKPLGDFYVHSQMADGHLNKCKKCCRAAEKLYRRTPKFRARMLAYDVARSQTLERRETMLETQRRRRRKHPEKTQAYSKVARVFGRGFLFRPSCEICGQLAQAHHEDYSKPFEIRWLCFKHHREFAHNQIVGTL